MSVHLALKETSDFKEAVTLMDVWKSAMIMSGGQCVMTHGAHLMLKLSVESWGILPLVSMIIIS